MTPSYDKRAIVFPAQVAAVKLRSKPEKGTRLTMLKYRFIRDENSVFHRKQHSFKDNGVL